MDTPCNLTAAKPRDSWGNLMYLLSQLPLLGLTDANENINYQENKKAEERVRDWF